MRRRNTINKNREKKERLIMLGSAVFVLTALTMTGVYVKGTSEKEKNDGYTIDFDALEDTNEAEIQTVPSDLTASVEDNNTDNSSEGTLGMQSAQNSSDITQDDFMDYIPPVEDADLTADTSESITAEEDLTAVAEEEEPMVAQAAEFAEIGDEEASLETAGEAVANVNHPTLNFTEEDVLTWPIVGNVLINYSMDKTTYFATLDQYKYSPAIVIGATEGETITAAATGKVVDIYEDEEIGNAVVMDLGGGYELTYGQLEDVQVSEGSYVETGDVIGNVAAPTKYYSVEGANVYFALTKDGVPVNPMGKLN